MPSFPKIDSPCPLRWKSAPTAGRDFCTQCRRRVHNLDAMSDVERRALLAGCATDICVSYSVPRRRIAAAGLGLAAALSFGAAAADVPADRSPVATPLLVPSETKADCATETEEPEEIEILVGGISSARDAEWDEASNLPDLPVAGPDAFSDEAEFVASPTTQPD